MADENKAKKFAPKLVTPQTTMDPEKARVRISVRQNGKGLVGMMGWGDNAASGIVASEGLRKALGIARDANGCVKIEISGDQLVGSKVRTKPGEPWGTHLDSLHAYLKEDTPAYFTLFRTTQQCLLVTYVPEIAKPVTKMLYAATKNAVKEAIGEIDADCHVEEFNVSTAGELSYSEYTKRENTPKFYTEHELLANEHKNAETPSSYALLARIQPMDKHLDKEKLAKIEKLRKNGAFGTQLPEQQFQSGGEEFAKPVALPGLVNMKKLVPRAIQTRLEDAQHIGDEDSEQLAKNFKQKAVTTSVSENEDKELKEKFHLVPQTDKSVISETAVKKEESKKVDTETSVKEGVVEIKVEPEVENKLVTDDVNEALKEMSEELEEEVMEQNYHADIDTDNEQGEDKLNKDNIYREKKVNDQSTENKEQPKTEEVTQHKTTEVTDLEKDKETEEDEEENEEEEVEENEEPKKSSIQQKVESRVEEEVSTSDAITQKPSLKKQQTDKSKLFVGNFNSSTGNNNNNNNSLVSKVTRSLSFKLPSFTRKTNATSSAKDMVKSIAEKTTRLLRKAKNTGNVILDQQFLNSLSSEDGVRSYEELQAMKKSNDFEGCDKNILETYLSSRDFALVFGVTREDFEKMSAWKQKKLKKKVNLF